MIKEPRVGPPQGKCYLCGSSYLMSSVHDCRPTKANLGNEIRMKDAPSPLVVSTEVFKKLTDAACREEFARNFKYKNAVQYFSRITPEEIILKVKKAWLVSGTDFVPMEVIQDPDMRHYYIDAITGLTGYEVIDDPSIKDDDEVLFLDRRQAINFLKERLLRKIRMIDRRLKKYSCLLEELKEEI